ncbi:hypothetical protein L9F63_024940, partial [Diploptera punctata]
FLIALTFKYEHHVRKSIVKMLPSTGIEVRENNPDFLTFTQEIDDTLRFRNKHGADLKNSPMKCCTDRTRIEYYLGTSDTLVFIEILSRLDVFDYTRGNIKPLWCLKMASSK